MLYSIQSDSLKGDPSHHKARTHIPTAAIAEKGFTKFFKWILRGYVPKSHDLLNVNVVDKLFYEVEATFVCYALSIVAAMQLIVGVLIQYLPIA